jgi:hypothetical protein
VEVEDDRCVVSEEAGPLRVGETMGVVAGVDQLKEINNVDASNLELREVLEQEINGGQRLVSADITARGHDQVGILSSIGGELRPDTNTLGAMLDGSVHGEVLKMLLLIRNNNVDVVDGSETMVHDCGKLVKIRQRSRVRHTRKQTVAIRRKVDADNLGALVGDNVEETGILVSETVVILTPDNGSQEDVERGNLGSPLNLETLLDPLAVL